MMELTSWLRRLNEKVHHPKWCSHTGFRSQLPSHPAESFDNPKSENGPSARIYCSFVSWTLHIEMHLLAVLLFPNGGQSMQIKWQSFAQKTRIFSQLHPLVLADLVTPGPPPHRSSFLPQEAFAIYRSPALTLQELKFFQTSPCYSCSSQTQPFQLKHVNLQRGGEKKSNHPWVWSKSNISRQPDVATHHPSTT